MGPILLLLWIGSFIGGWILASQRSGNSIGCLWAVILFILGPLAPIVFLLYAIIGKDNKRDSDWS